MNVFLIILNSCIAGNTVHFYFRPELVRPGALMVQQASPGNEANSGSAGMATSVIRISPNPPVSSATLQTQAQHTMSWKVESPSPPPPPPPPLPPPPLLSAEQYEQPSVVVSSMPGHESLILQQALTSNEVCHCLNTNIYLMNPFIF